jgi:UDP-N-acetylmuramoyl-L-alanyl-D-glutamate--2,6-diaminopimelate ligase
MIQNKLTNSIYLEDIQSLMLSEVDRSAHLSSDTRLLRKGDVFLAYPVGQGIGRSDNRIHIPAALDAQVSLIFYELNDWPETLYPQVRELLGDSRCIPVKNLADMASEIADWWYGHPSSDLNVIGVTGTNGKTTISHWLAQAFGKSGSSAVLGTLGYGEIGQLKTTGFTTPDAPRVQRILSELRASSVKNIAMEVSSHALEQGRVNHIQFKTAIFSNLSQDHLDYHGSMEEYARAKYELFQFRSLQQVILNVDDAIGRQWIEELVKKEQLSIWIYGTETSFLLLSDFAKKRVHPLLLKNIQSSVAGMKCDVEIKKQSYALDLESIGEFNIYNAAAVLATLIANDVTIEKALSLVTQLKSVDGRMEIINAKDDVHPLMVVDFAHTPDALQKALLALRPIAKTRAGHLICVFGCGGNRDRSKRPLMGGIAAQLADRVIITSDNPRFENPEDIIEQIMSGVDENQLLKVSSVTDRAFAILSSVKQSQKNDVVLVAGKGHERTQEIAGNKFAFSDQDHIRLAIRGAA